MTESKTNLCIRRYTFKLYPNAAQEAAMQSQAALLAALWNAALEQREIQWAHECQNMRGDWKEFTGSKRRVWLKGERRGISKYDQQRELKKLRAENPEYAAIGQDTEALCLTALDDAFKAFFKRAKGGAGKSSGYPRYKSIYGIENKGKDCTIWHREHRKGWRMDRAGKHSARIYAKGIPGTIKARGKFPVDVGDLEIRDMRISRRSGIWQCSIVVRMEPRRMKNATAPSATVEFDLIDEFVRVKTGANGECLSGWDEDFASSDERISTQNQEDTSVSGAEASDLMADDRTSPSRLGRRRGAEASDLMADDRQAARQVVKLLGAEASDRLADQIETDQVQSERDRRFKKFSYRWKQEARRIAKRRAREARQRKEALHLWTTRLVKSSSELEVICPQIKESTKSTKGNERDHGAAVKTVAKLNRHVLAQAPAMAIQMLEYKAAEAGIAFAHTRPEEHHVRIGQELAVAIKEGRRARRTTRKAK